MGTPPRPFSTFITPRRSYAQGLRERRVGNHCPFGAYFGGAGVPAGRHGDRRYHSVAQRLHIVPRQALPGSMLTEVSPRIDGTACAQPGEPAPYFPGASCQDVVVENLACHRS